ncbi:hypothetical protein LAZ67_18001010 [Cordylochernes scorpioides]|uniref:RNase H type-1 domain-containing protein n=1 Tax=Cordylochernes scorpioides TaxID=51811 RepID=A0ABY6LGA5_9ARAC|nr:hypothetical protein LAZ67_18001010 [Cordylochernes scorpioides]
MYDPKGFNKDGSKTKDGVGAGLYRVWVNDNLHEMRVCYVLSRYCSVFQAEAFNLNKALENASELPLIPLLRFSWTIFQLTGNFLINRALLLISLLNRNRNRCSIRWIKGRSGIVGNDVADALAKGGAGSDLPSCYRLAPLSELESTARKQAWAAWQIKFDPTDRPICTRFGLTPMSLLDKKFAFIIPSVPVVVVLLSGHTWTAMPTKWDLLIIPPAPTATLGGRRRLNIFCSSVTASTSLDFAFYLSLGRELGHTPRSLRDFIHSKPTWQACVDFLLASNRLKPRIRERESKEMSKRYAVVEEDEGHAAVVGRLDDAVVLDKEGEVANDNPLSSIAEGECPEERALDFNVALQEALRKGPTCQSHEDVAIHFGDLQDVPRPAEHRINRPEVLVGREVRALLNILAVFLRGGGLSGLGVRNVSSRGLNLLDLR